MIGALREDALVKDWDDLCLFLNGARTSFTGKLLELIQKADPGNRAKLAAVYPREVAAWREWMLHDTSLTAAQLDTLIGLSQ